MSRKPAIGVFGEVLFDHFPDGRSVLGGAPFNVAWHLAAFGLDPLLISAVGEDADGRAVREAMRQWGMRDSALGRDQRLGTGRVTVSFDEGEPAYDIVHPSAFDAIGNLPPESLDWLYHGTLALRSETSRATLEALAARHRGRIILDVNLRDPWWQRDTVMDRVQAAHWVKLNADELDRLGGDADGFLDANGLEGLILTRGAGGASVLTCDGRRTDIVPAAVEGVVDTVGAGDAFASVMLLGLCRGWDQAVCLQRAQSFASALCRVRGATVEDRALYEAALENWQQPPEA